MGGEVEGVGGPKLYNLVSALSRRPVEPYDDYVRRVANYSNVAANIKRFDLLDNMDPRRLALLPEAEVARLRAKYKNAIAILGEAVK